MARSGNTDLTQGNITKQLILFMLPFLFSNILQAVYNITDVFIISRFLDAGAVAAAHSGGQIMSVCINIASGLSVGGTIVIGRFTGAKDKDGVRKTVPSFFLIAGILGMLTTLVVVLFSSDFLRAINTQEEIFAQADSFLKIYGLGVFFIFGNNAIFALFRGSGNSKATLVFVMISTVTNLVLDYVFVAIFGWGIDGAAWATTIAIVLCFCASVFYFIRKRSSFYLSGKGLRPDFALCKRILILGVPSAVQLSIFSFSVLFMTSFINVYGVSATAATAVGSKIDSLALLPFQAMLSASSAMISQNIGAKNETRVRKTFFSTLGVTFGIAIFTFTLTQLFPDFFMKIFTDDPEVLEIGIKYLRIVAFNHLFVSVLQSANGLATGSGNTILPLFMTIMNGFVFRVPIGLFFENTMGMGLYGVYMGFGFANVGGAIFGLIYYKSGHWKRALRDGFHTPSQKSAATK